MNHLTKIKTDVDYMLRAVGAEVYAKSEGRQKPVGISELFLPKRNHVSQGCSLCANCVNPS